MPSSFFRVFHRSESIGQPNPAVATLAEARLELESNTGSAGKSLQFPQELASLSRPIIAQICAILSPAVSQGKAETTGSLVGFLSGAAHPLMEHRQPVSSSDHNEPMRRREFVAALPCAAYAQSAAPDLSLNAFSESIFLEILRGYVTNLARTSDSYAVIEYSGATVTKGFLSKSGLSVTGVSRMLPALAAWIAAKRQPAVLSIEGSKYDLLDLAGSALANGTNPAHKDYWQAPNTSALDQRQVEASIIAWSVWLLRDSLLPQMSVAERQRIDAWLASCTAVPVRRNNWAWFTAVNHAARMALKDRFDEFSYDQTAMFEDLKALDAMYAGGGWYNDDQPRQSFDYYNSWVFASHFLYWNALVGQKFPDWSKRFSDRLREYLGTAPLFFGSNGSHVLYGRSLIYRWAALTPLVLAYQQQLWPHNPAVLHRIVRSNLDFHWSNGAFDAAPGKLRETFSTGGTVDIHESYIDGGHPYWGMQAFALWLIPRDDPFWQATGGALPVQQADFQRSLTAPGMLLTGHKASGQVRLLQARSTKTDWHYRDKYNKFLYSSHFPMNVVQRPDVTAWDNALVLREKRSRKSAGRGELEQSTLQADGADLAYSIELGEFKVRVRTTVLLSGEFEIRVHRIVAPAAANPGIELVEGSSSLGLQAAEDAENVSGEGFSIVRNRKTNLLIGSWSGPSWAGLGAAWDFGASETAASNIVYPAMQVNTLWATLKPGPQALYSVHYASPAPLPVAGIRATAAKLLARARLVASGTRETNKPVKQPAEPC